LSVRSEDVNTGDAEPVKERVHDVLGEDELIEKIVQDGKWNVPETVGEETRWILSIHR
jgi:hypothetical protein